MIRLLKCEYKKTRGRWIFVMALVITAAQIAWGLYGDYDSEFIIKNGWMSFLYQLPLVNAIFLPLLSIIVSSRLCDIEHKGAMMKQLAVVADRWRIYDAKLIYGLAIVLFCNILSWSASVICGYAVGFEGDVPIRLYLIYLLFTAVPTIAVYIFQHTLSLLFKNQAVTFFTGIIGAFCGLFSMFLPQLPFLRRMFIWGYYGVLQFVGMFGWTKETRYASAYFDVMDFNWIFFGVLILICIMTYIIGKLLFCRKEV
ncbi:MAG: ABC transporter permease subunit [Clostridia bacterium]|nr:ABC transporter permease subunit [Clostridia bacterium]